MNTVDLLKEMLKIGLLILLVYLFYYTKSITNFKSGNLYIKNKSWEDKTKQLKQQN